MIYDVELGHSENAVIVDPSDATKIKKLDVEDFDTEELLKPIFKDGKLVYDCPDLHAIQDQVKKEIDRIHGGIKRFVNPHVYVVGLERNLYEKRLRLILEQRKLIS